MSIEETSELSGLDKLKKAIFDSTKEVEAFDALISGTRSVPLAEREAELVSQGFSTEEVLTRIGSEYFFFYVGSVRQARKDINELQSIWRGELTPEDVKKRRSLLAEDVKKRRSLKVAANELAAINQQAQTPEKIGLSEGFEQRDSKFIPRKPGRPRYKEDMEAEDKLRAGENQDTVHSEWSRAIKNRDLVDSKRAWNRIKERAETGGNL